MAIAIYLGFLVLSGAVIHYFFPWVDILRVPLLCGLVFLLFPFLSRAAGVKAFVEGMFEVTRWDIFQVTLATLMTAAALLTCTDIVVSYGRLRVAGIPELPECLRLTALAEPIQLSWLSFLLGAIYFLGVVFYLVHLRPLERWGIADFGEILLGAALFAVILEAAWLITGIAGLDVIVGWFAQHLSNGAGYINPDTGLAFRSHVIAVSLSTLAAAAFLIFGWVRYRAIRNNPTVTTAKADSGASVPTLAWVVILIMLACWILSGLAFWMDARRIPLFIPLALLVGLCGWLFPKSDHVFPLSAGRVDGPTPREVLSRGDDRIVIVAASGGGIQAAAWAATVVEELTAEVPGFASHVRLLSTVSGGSTGLMYFAAAYRNGDVDLAALEKAVPGGKHPLFRLASSPSLDNVAWGLAFPDFFRSWLPVLFPQEVDRAWALARAWVRYEGMEMLRDARLGHWAADAANGVRPPVSFNATIAETGVRYLLSTFRLERPLFGRKEFPSDPGNADIEVATAVGLSAAFPYVSPACRPDPDRDKNGKPLGHVVDGGYYDNYGIATAIDFLSEGLPDATGKRILLLHIEAGRYGEPQVTSTERGWFFQVLAPPQGLLGVWDTGMRSRNDVEIGLMKSLIESRGGQFTSLRVDFPKSETPTSWYLTREDKKAIRDGWEEKRQTTVDSVKQFMA